MRDWMLKARKSKGLTMKQAAAELGITESYYSLIEKEDRQKSLDMTMAKKLASLFGMSIQQVVDAESQ